MLIASLLLLLASYWWPHSKVTKDTLQTEAGSMTVTREHWFWGRNMMLGPDFWELRYRQSIVDISSSATPIKVLWRSDSGQYKERAISFSRGKVFLALDLGIGAPITDCFRYRVVMFESAKWVEARALIDVSSLDWTPLHTTSQPPTPFPFFMQDSSRLSSASPSALRPSYYFDINEELAFCKTKQS